MKCSCPDCPRPADPTLTGYDGPFCGPCHELAEELTRILKGGRRAVPCAECGLEVPEARRCYATPVCYACLPPPPPLPIRKLR